jgi:hypothetical protein
MLVTIPTKIALINNNRFFLFWSPTSDGSAAAIVVSENYILKHPEVQKNAVEILAIEMATDFTSTFESNDCMRLVKFYELS